MINIVSKIKKLAKLSINFKKFSNQKSIEEDEQIGDLINQINDLKKQEDTSKEKTSGQNAPENQKEKMQDILYQKYIEKVKKPLITKDNYRIQFLFILRRQPIYYPYDKLQFVKKKTFYQNQIKQGYYPKIAKQLLDINVTQLYNKFIYGEDEISYAQKNQQVVKMLKSQLLYFKQVDPNIINDKSNQTYSTQNVFLLVKNQKDQWIFPQKIFFRKLTFKEICSEVLTDIFGRIHIVKWIYEPLNVKIHKYEEDEPQQLKVGNGYKLFYFEGLYEGGQFLKGKYQDYAWVPKQLLNKYLSRLQFTDVAPILKIEN